MTERITKKILEMQDNLKMQKKKREDNITHLTQTI
jgi:hypothetical protein